MVISILDMSRMLAELLGVPVPGFRLNVQQLEAASGNPGVDIRLSSEILQAAQIKISELGLDAFDTKPIELYEVLKSRAQKDNQRLETTLQQRIGKGQISLAIVKSLQSLSIPKTCFAIKHSSAKRILKKNPPKSTMRQLGYRSLDSLLKRESTSLIFAVASLVESTAWRQRLFEEYKHLVPSDFEVREIEIVNPLRTKNWKEMAAMLAEQQRSSVLVTKELGGVILLPLPNKVVAGTLTTVVLSLQAINDIRTQSAFCKLQQVKPDFGTIIADSAKSGVKALALVAGQPVPWQIIQSYYDQYGNDYPSGLFEPHVQEEDLKLAKIEDSLISLEPSLEFWRGTNWLAFGQGGDAVSINITDVAIASSNNLPYNKRLLDNFRNSVWTELMIRYLQQNLLEEKVLAQLNDQLVDRPGEVSFEANFAGA